MRPWYTPLIAPAGPKRAWFMVGVALHGPVFAVIQFGEVIARKSLGASTLQVALLVMVMPLTSFTALWWSRWMTGRDQRIIMAITGGFGYLVLMTGFWLDSIPHLLLMFIFYYMTWAVVLTGRNRVLQQHVSVPRRGTTFGASNTIRVAIAALVAWLAGSYMDRVADGYRHLFVLAGLFGLVSTWVWATMETKDDPEHKEWSPNRHTLMQPLVEAWRLLKRRPDYLRFELGFMTYGVAFMMTLPVVPIYLVDELGLDYSTIGLAKGTVFQLTMIPAIWLFGRLFDRGSPQMLASRAFAFLALFAVVLLSASLVPARALLPVTLLAFMLQGIGMGGVTIVWSVGSVRFAVEEDAGIYQAVHVAMTGVRGAFAPLLGFVVMETFGLRTALAVSSLLWVAASLLMRGLHRRDGLALLEREQSAEA